MKRLFFFLALWHPLYGIGQDTLSIAEQIHAYPFSKYDQISKGRRLLLDKFEAGEIEEVSSIIRYFDTEINDANHVALWPAERLLLYYWTEDFDKIFHFSAYFNEDKEHETEYGKKVYPPEDLLFFKLQEASHRDFDTLIRIAHKYDFSEDSDDYLHLLLERLLYNPSGKFIDVEKINEDADLFIKKHPDSPLVEMVKKSLSQKLVPGDFSFTMYVGGGYALASGAYTHYFYPKGSVGLSLDFHWKRFAFLINGNVAFSKLKQEIAVNDTDFWEKGNRVNFSTWGLSLGYSILKNERFRLTPFAGVGFSSASPPQNNDTPDHLKNFNIGTSCSGIFGMSASYQLSKPITKRDYSRFHSTMDGSFGINARVSYVPAALRSEGHRYGGNIVYLTIGFNLDYFYLKRAY